MVKNWFYKIPQNYSWNKFTIASIKLCIDHNWKSFLKWYGGYATNDLNIFFKAIGMHSFDQRNFPNAFVIKFYNFHKRIEKKQCFAVTNRWKIICHLVQPYQVFPEKFNLIPVCIIRFKIHCANSSQPACSRQHTEKHEGVRHTFAFQVDDRIPRDD